MRSIITILFFIITSCADGQRQVLGVLKNGAVPSSNAPIMIIFIGESNSGGYADNSLASAPEQAVRNIPIFNNVTRVMEGLEIGVNNLLYHSGLSSCCTHGFELGLANQFDDGDFGSHPVYIVKTGQGGSKIAEWETTDPYYDSLEVRVQAAFDLINAAHPGETPQIFIWYSLGINDALASTPTATWKAAVISFFSNVRTTINTIVGASLTIPVMMTRFNTVGMSLAYDAQILELDTEVSDCYAVSCVGAALKDGNHWQYSGFKNVIVPAFITITLTYL